MAKGRQLRQDAQELNFTLLTDPAHPTIIGNSTTRDTAPDLTFVRNSGAMATTWKNTLTDLSSHHMIIEIHIQTPDKAQGSDPKVELDKDFSAEEITTALHNFHSRSTPGPDGVSNGALKNLDDRFVEQLTAFINDCWQRGSLPQQWKTTKTTIPKPGKALSLDNLRPISLTSCVDKTTEHALLNQWQAYLEQKGAYPPSIIGFHPHLSTQGPTIQLKHQVIDGKTRGTRAILGLDLGDRALGDLTPDIAANPRWSVISPTLFNLVMIGLAEKLELKDVRHTIYAYDITIWVHEGSNGHIEMALQLALDTIEEYLVGRGLRCSPKKSGHLL
ncbi:uncharacterized protein LOC142586210 [Dermacentor variabilis]|uniref:uncharacterized protein LOC142586210 n=1 Tax=Dermacentor variabilis TaxID=34621 RepID=UPI003F5C8AD2